MSDAELYSDRYDSFTKNGQAVITGRDQGNEEGQKNKSQPCLGQGKGCGEFNKGVYALVHVYKVLRNWEMVLRSSTLYCECIHFGLCQIHKNIQFASLVSLCILTWYVNIKRVCDRFYSSQLMRDH